MEKHGFRMSRRSSFLESVLSSLIGKRLLVKATATRGGTTQSTNASKWLRRPELTAPQHAVYGN